MSKKALIKINTKNPGIETHHGFQPDPRTTPLPLTHHSFALNFDESPRRVVVTKDEEGNIILTFED